MKKIWLISIVLGLLTALTFFAYISQEKEKQVTVNPEKPKDELPEVQLSEKDPNNKSNLSIAYGKRALTISVNEVQGLAGALKKDDYVDVIAVNSSESGEAAFSRVIVEQIKVLSVGNYKPAVQSETETEETAEETPPVETPETIIPYALVTLEVLPQQGADLALAAEKGTIVLMLRSREDPTTLYQEPSPSERLNKGEVEE